MTKKIDLTVALITKNEEDRLPATLSSVRNIASEIIVVDSGSTDDTINIARKYGAIVYSHPWEGFAAQKNFLATKCSRRWILFLDADEVLTSELQQEILQAVIEDRNISYEINRKTAYLGKILNHAWQKNYRLRLVRKDQNPKWIGDVVHEELVVSSPHQKLRNHLIHHSYRNIRDHFSKTVFYANLAANDYFKKGRKSSIAKIILKPTFAFFKMYLLQRSFLDGFPGLVASVSSSIYSFLKYSILYDVQKN